MLRVSCGRHSSGEQRCHRATTATTCSPNLPTGPNLPPADSKLHNVLTIGDSISWGAMTDVTNDLAGVAMILAWLHG